MQIVENKAPEELIFWSENLILLLLLMRYINCPTGLISTFFILGVEIDKLLERIQCDDDW